MAELTLEDVTNVIQKETRELGVKFEDLQNKVEAALESISKNLVLQNEVDDHEIRLTAVESDNELLKSTVAIHSKQLNTV